MPKQVSRLLIVFGCFLGIFLLLRVFLVPKSFGEYGHYRGDALKEIASLNVKFVPREKCTSCHETNAKMHTETEHAKINCQTCHGPGYKHVEYYEKQSGLQKADSLRDTSKESPEEFRLVKSDEKAFCLKCHDTNAARPEKAIIQIDPADHHANKKCVKCHNPHAPNS